MASTVWRIWTFDDNDSIHIFISIQDVLVTVIIINLKKKIILLGNVKLVCRPEKYPIMIIIHNDVSNHHNLNSNVAKMK